MRPTGTRMRIRLPTVSQTTRRDCAAWMTATPPSGPVTGTLTTRTRSPPGPSTVSVIVSPSWAALCASPSKGRPKEEDEGLESRTVPVPPAPSDGNRATAPMSDSVAAWKGPVGSPRSFLWLRPPVFRPA
jgi:hypothetical protein